MTLPGPKKKKRYYRWSPIHKPTSPRATQPWISTSSPAYCSPLVDVGLPYRGGFAHSHHAGQVGWWPQRMLLNNVVFTRGAAAHLPDKPLIAFYDTRGRKGGDGILLCRHHKAEYQPVWLLLFSHSSPNDEQQSLNSIRHWCEAHVLFFECYFRCSKLAER